MTCIASERSACKTSSTTEAPGPSGHSAAARQRWHESMSQEFLRFAGVGLLNTVAGYVLYLLLLRFLPYTVSFSLSYAAGIGISYALHSRFVFRRALEWNKALRYPAVYGIQYVLGVLLLWAAVERLAVDPRIAALIAVALTVPVVFWMSRRIIRGGPMYRTAAGGPSSARYP